jgi:phosphotransferase system HPr-like phosphotransfer protein
MKKYRKLIIIPIALALLVLGFSLIKGTRPNSTSQNQEVVKEFKANLKISLDDQEKSYDISQYIGMTVLDAMEKAGIKIEKSGEGENAFLTGIEGRITSTGKREFWEFLVNGNQTEVGAGTYKVQNNDQIQWKVSNY